MHETSAAGLVGYLESVDYVTSNGINIFGMSLQWIELEPTTSGYAFQNFISNPLTLLDPEKTKFNSRYQHYSDSQNPLYINMQVVEGFQFMEAEF